VNWWILFGLAEFYVTIVTSTLEGSFGHRIIVDLRVRCLDLALMEHGFQRSRLVVVLTIEEFYLQEVMAII
jgi:hypothetical protein